MTGDAARREGRARNALIWALAGVAAFAYLVVMTATGAMPVRRQLIEANAQGVLTVAEDAVRRVDIRRDGAAASVSRASSGDGGRDGGGGGEWTIAEGGGLSAAAAERLETAIRMMRRSGPVRVIEAAELGDADDARYGLDPPALTVALYGGGGESLLSVRFGALNPEGFQNYMRIDGDDRLYLMSRFIAAEWRAALDGSVGAPDAAR